MKKWFIALGAAVALIVTAVVIFLFVCCDEDVPMAPLYAYDMLEATEVKWEVEGEKIGGNAIINHSGEKSHSYLVITSIVSDAGQKFISSTDKGKIERHNQHLRRYGWSDMDQSIRDTIDWPTARVWCEIRIFDENDVVVFHGIKRSELFPADNEDQ